MNQLHIPSLQPAPDGSGFYEADDGRKFVRVTHAVGVALPPYLVPWAENVGRQSTARYYQEVGNLPMDDKVLKSQLRDRGWDCESQKQSGGLRGGEIHTGLEAYIATGEPPSLDDFEETTKPYVQSLAAFLLDYAPEFEESEQICCHEALSYAGQYDGICTITKQPPRRNKPWDLEGKRVLFDVKTNKDARVYWPQHHYQVAAYELARLSVDADPTDHQIIVAIGPAKDGKPKYSVGVSYVEPEQFEHVIAMYDSLEATKANNPNRRKK